MGRMMKVRCNGQNKDVNEVDVSNALRTDSVTRETAASQSSNSQYPERIVLRCHNCTDGKVVITRAMLENFFGSNQT